MILQTGQEVALSHAGAHTTQQQVQPQHSQKQGWTKVRWTTGGWTVLEASPINLQQWAVGSFPHSTDMQP